MYIFILRGFYVIWLDFVSKNRARYRVYDVRCRVMSVNSLAANVSRWRGARAVNLMVGWSVASA